MMLFGANNRLKSAFGEFPTCRPNKKSRGQTAAFIPFLLDILE